MEFYKVPQKDLGEEEECTFHTDLANDSISEIASQKTQKLIFILSKTFPLGQL